MGDIVNIYQINNVFAKKGILFSLTYSITYTYNLYSPWTILIKDLYSPWSSQLQ